MIACFFMTVCVTGVGHFLPKMVDVIFVNRPLHGLPASVYLLPEGARRCDRSRKYIDKLVDRGDNVFLIHFLTFHNMYIKRLESVD